ncbi:MAG: PepSY1/2 domain-containing protein [Christensenellales bacterium]
MKKTRTLIAIIVALVVTAGVLAVGWIGSRNTMNAYAGQLESSYQKSFSELIDGVNNVEVNLSKAILTQDDAKKQQLYQTINQQCTLCATNLSNLPINHQSIVETTKFVNQLGGFSYYLSQKLNNGQTLTDADNSSVNELYNWCVYVQTVVNDFAKNLNDDFSILLTTSNGNFDSDFDSMFANTSATGTEYPTLIYDGPFSDSIKNKEMQGVVGEEMTAEQVAEKIKDVFYQYNPQNIESTGTITGKFDGYSFSFTTKNRTYYLQVAKKGGMFISVSSYGQLSNKQISLGDAETEAENFAKLLGVDMKSVWSTELNGVAYINLTPVINNVIVYPDMIKAKVSLDTGSILGWEAQSYAYNHAERKDYDFVVAEETARQMVNKNFNIMSIKKCIIPQEYGSEELCYEYKCTYNDYVYYVYISAKTGSEVETLRVVKTSGGELLK